MAITGTGAVTALGRGFDSLLDRWLAGDVAGSDAVAPCEDFDPHETMTAKEIRRNDLVTQFAVDASVQALEEAGWQDEFPVPPARIGCVIGTAFGGFDTLAREIAKFSAPDSGPISPLLLPRAMHNAPVSSLAIRLGIHGPTSSIVAACTSSADAIGMATRWIREGYVDAVIAGGSDNGTQEFLVASFRTVGTLSPSGVARPFDADRDGFVMGEGAGVFVLEAMEVAHERGAEVLGEVRGYGGSSDGFHPTSPDPEGRFAAQCIREALDDAGVEPGAVAYVNAHGTGTRLNDPSETRAIKRALGEAAYEVPVSSTKSVIGHAMGAAGAIEAGVTVQALRRGVIPPTVNHAQPDEDLDLDYVPHGTEGPVVRPPAMRGSEAIAISNSFGFGGHNAVVCVSAPMGAAGRSAESNGQPA